MAPAPLQDLQEVAFGSEHGIIAFPLHFATSLVSTRRSAMTISWSDACKNAFNQPLQTKLNYAYGSCGATVRATACFAT
jgi:hypothetical protein